MIVRCIRIISPVTDALVCDHPGMRVGALYPVVELLAGAGRVLLRIPGPAAGGNGFDTPGLWNAAMFAITDGRIPACWVAALEHGRLTLAPREWRRPGFWDDYADRVPAAVADYDRLKAEILGEPGNARRAGP